MSSGNQRYINTAGTHNITMGDDFINVSTSVGAITLVFPNIRDSGAINLNKVWFVNDVDDMAATNNVTIVASVTSPVTELNGGTSVVLDTNGFSAEIVPSGYYSYMVNSGTGGVQPKIYKALLTQTGTDAPVATVLVNTLSGTPVWSYEYVGGYALTLASEFVSGKTAYSITTFQQASRKAIISDNFPNQILVDTTDNSGTGYNDVLLNTLITIEVYP